MLIVAFGRLMAALRLPVLLVECFFFGSGGIFF